MATSGLGITLHICRMLPMYCYIRQICPTTVFQLNLHFIQIYRFSLHFCDKGSQPKLVSVCARASERVSECKAQTVIIHETFVRSLGTEKNILPASVRATTLLHLLAMCLCARFGFLFIFRSFVQSYMAYLTTKIFHMRPLRQKNLSPTFVEHTT